MITLYGGGASQPSRAVWWACLIKELPFELKVTTAEHVMPGSPLRHINPVLQAPAIADGDFTLAEMPAILCYLSDAYGWGDFYPKDLKARAIVNQYLHFHHNFTRQATFQLMATHVTIAFLDMLREHPDPTYKQFVQLAESPDKLAIGQHALNGICTHIENAYLLNGATYLCGDQPTIADIACYQELAQLRWANLYHFEKFPKIAAWLDKMTQLPYHDEAHCYNLTLGDISEKNPNTMERYAAANEASVAAIAKLGIPVTPFE